MKKQQIEDTLHLLDLLGLKWVEHSQLLPKGHLCSYNGAYIREDSVLGKLIAMKEPKTQQEIIDMFK